VPGIDNNTLWQRKGKVEGREEEGRVEDMRGRKGWEGRRKRGGRSGADHIPCSKTLDISGDEIFRMGDVGEGEN